VLNYFLQKDIEQYGARESDQAVLPERKAA